MSDSRSRRNFLAAGIALPAAAKLPPVSSAPAAVPALHYRVLGKTGLKVTEVGCGSEAVSDSSVLQRAVDLGINFFDTARPYEGGANERALAAALGTRRKNVIVSSRSYGKERKAIEDDLDTSLKELRTDYLDIWYIGSKDKPSDVSDGMLEAQVAAQKAGKIRFRGFSTHRLSEMLPFILDKGRFDVVQTPYNFAMGSARDPMKMFATGLEESIDRLHKAGIGVVAMKVMAGGYRERGASDPLFSLYRKPGAHVSALRWALRNPHVSTTSVRMASHDFLEENIRAMERPFGDDDAQVLAAHLERIKPLYCRMCGACDGACPKGLPVADLVRFVTYADGYREFAMGYERFRRLPEEQRNVRCATCAACPVECPNGVRVRERVSRAQELFA